MNQVFKISFTNPLKFPIKEKFLDVILFIGLFLILQYEYYDFVNIPLFQEKMGFDFAFSTSKFLAGQAMVAMAIFINLKLKSFNYFANSLMLIFLSFPAIILFEFMPNTPIIISLSALLFHILYFISSGILLDIKPNIIPIFSESKKLWIFIIITLAAIIPLVIAFGFDINFKAFNPYKVYEVRAAAAQKDLGLSNYLYSWLIKIIIPLGLILSIKKRKWFSLFVFVILQVYLFTTEAQKSAFISLFVLLILLIKTYEKQVRWVIASLLFLIIISKTTSFITGDIMMESIVVRRSFFLPSIIINDYFDFFKNNHTYLSHSIFRNFIDYPFSLNPPQLIGERYFSNAHANVNSGFISDGFMNFGYAGVFLYVLGVTLVLKTIEIIRISPIYSGIIIIIIYTFISSYFLTSLLSHGVILFIILAFLFLRNTRDEKL